MRFVKENFLLDRSFWNISDLNQSALTWCNLQNQTYHKEINGVPEDIHFSVYAANIRSLIKEIQKSFSGILRYESDIGICWPFFHVSENLITLIPDSLECREAFATTESTDENESAEERNNNHANSINKYWCHGEYVGKIYLETKSTNMVYYQ